MIIKMILTNSFDPDPRVYKEAKTLAKLGSTIEILAWDRESKYPNKSIDNCDGILIRRFYSKGKYGAGISQLLGFFGFIKQVRDYLKNIKYDFLHCHDFDGLIVGYFIKLFNPNVKLIYDEHDLFYLYFEGRKGLINKLISKIIKISEEYILRKVHSHIVVTPNMKLLYEDKSNPIVITNAPMKEAFCKIQKLKREKIVVGFIGNIRYIEELKVLIDVANKFSSFEIFIAGKGTKLNELQEYICNNSYMNIEIFGEYDISQLEELYSKIDITFLVYPLKDALISLPNKFFESIITKTPMIASSNSEFGNIIEKEYFGWCVDNDNLESNLTNIFELIVNDKKIINEVRNKMLNNSYDYLWESNTDKLKNIYT